LRGDFAQACVSLAQLREQQGADDEVVDLCREALYVDPTLAEAHVLLANTAARRGNLNDAAEHLRIAVKINPHLPDEYIERGSTLLRQGKLEVAMRLLQAGVTLRPGDARTTEILAQLLATAPYPAVRNGKEAVKLALRAVELGGGHDAQALNTLAAAYAEAGQFPDAVRTAATARDLATAAGQPDLAADIQRRLEMFRAGKAFHEGKW
jgi:tetratricopeptide (TPR) repeat protein